MSKRCVISVKGVLLAILLAGFMTQLHAECKEETPGDVFCKRGDILTIRGETGHYLPCTDKRVIIGPGDPLSAVHYTCGAGVWLNGTEKYTYECHRAPLNCPASYE